MTTKERLAQLRALQRVVESRITMLEARLERERAGLERPSQREVAECGTDGGYYRHRRTLKDDPCDPCKAAHSKAESQRRARWAKARATVAPIAGRPSRQDRAAS